MKEKELIKLFLQTQNIQGSARDVGMSDSKARRILINAGLIPLTDSARKAREMYARGIPPKEIAETLHLSHKYVLSILPYRRQPWEGWSEDEDAAIKAGAAELPGRSKTAVIVRRARLKKEGENGRKPKKMG